MLSYYDNFYNTKFVDDDFFTPIASSGTNYQNLSSMPSLSSNFHNSLISVGASIGIGADTTGSSIHRVIQQYIDGKNISGVSRWVKTSPFFTDGTMRNIINDGDPMIMFGNIKNVSSNNKKGMLL